MKPESVAAFARKQCRARLKKLLKEARRTAKHPGDPEAIHDLRVSIRRFTQCLRTFRKLFDPHPLKGPRRQVRKIMQHCAAVRTCDVGIEVLRQSGIAKGPSVSTLAAGRTQAETRLRHHLKRQRRRKAADWKLELKKHVQRGSEWNMKQDLPENLARVLPKLAKELFAAGRMAAAAGDDPKKLHRFRLRVKHFRYIMELVPEFYGSELTEGLENLRELQDRLGVVNDCASTMAVIYQDNRADQPAMAAVKRLLCRREAEFQAFWKKQFPAEKLAWWRGWLGAPNSTSHSALPHPNHL